jgi:hypothetical protein
MLILSFRGIHAFDFSQIYGFPNILPKETYYLINGPKFNREDLGLTLEHISNFRDFTELLRVKHEDVFIGLFYDSLQGKCRSWADSLPPKSIRSISGFCVVFLETWMEKPELVADHVFVEGFKEYFDMFDDDQIEESFSKKFPMYLKSCRCSYKDKLNLLEEFVEKIENDLETLEGEIQSQGFHCQSLSFEDPFQLPFDVKVEENIKQMVDCSCEKILRKDIEHETTIDQEKLFVDKQTMFFHIIEDPFAILLESTMKMSFEMFINYGDSFIWRYKLSYFQFFFYTHRS